MTVLTKSYSAPSIDRGEILRYAQVSSPSQEILSLMEECIALAEKNISYKICYCELPLNIYNDTVDMQFAAVRSKDLQKNLYGCNSAILFGATLGSGLDRLITRYGATSPSKAFMLQAIGAERIEALCNLFNKEIKEEARAQGKSTSPRFSAGYGDLPLEFQREIFIALDCSRKIGLTLNSSLLMSPTKSVTAIIGIKNSV